MKQILLKILYSLLAYCARRYIKRHDIIVIGITWSVGKTSCRVIVSEVLKQVIINSAIENSDKNIFQTRVYTSPKNFNSELGLVLSVFQIEDYHPSIKNLLRFTWDIILKAFFWNKNTDILIAEYGIDSPGDMEQLLRVSIPDIAVLTKLDSVHAGNFPWGVREYWAEKWKLLLRVWANVYVNLQDEYSQEQYYLLPDYREIGDETEKNFHLVAHKTDIVRMNFEYHGSRISSNLIWADTMMYIKLWYDIAKDIGLEIQKQDQHFHFELQPGRFSFFKKWEHILIDSSYNAAPESVKLALEQIFLLQNNIFSDYKTLIVLGDMRELGDVAEEAHRELAPQLKKVDVLYTVWPLMYEYLISELHTLWYAWNLTSSLSARDIWMKLKTYLSKHSDEKYIILFKGSQNTIYTEEALAELLPKSEHKKLPRQEKYWKQKKEMFFNEV